MKNSKKLKTLLHVSGYTTTFLIAALSVARLFFDHRASWEVISLTVGLLILSPLPIAGSLFIARIFDQYAKESETFSTRDPLTGLYNQHTFWDLLQYETQRSKRQNYKFSLIHLDVDNFKITNDRYGHEVGDKFLQEIAGILKAAVRKGDILARYGGDNFTAILPVCDEEQAYAVSKRIMDNIRNHIMTLSDGTQVQGTVSIGVAVFPSHAQDAQDLFLLADGMLAQAKKSGKDHMTFPSEQNNVELLKNLGEKNIMILESLQSRKNKRLVPFFQPIIDVKDRSVLAHEVLTRITVDGRIIPAADFIEAAENMGAIGKIDYRLIEQTFAIVKERQYAGTLFLNLSPKAIVIAEFIPTICTLFRDFGIEPGKMVFEITERDTVKNIHIVESFVKKLKDEGFRFAIDDFGAGYSSFQYLKTFPVDYLKVDGDFIRNMHGSDTMEREIVKSIAQLADRLRIKTIAEYVESEVIMGEVASAGIHYAQGYYIQKPSPDLI